MPGRYPARMSDHGFWAAQSLVTEPGPAAVAIDRLPSDLGALRAASQQLVFHYWADGEYAANGIEPERISEIDTRYAAAMFDALDVPPDRFLTAPRAWQLARSGAVDPECFVVHPDLDIPATRGWPQLQRSLVRDLAALNKTEMLLWEDWGMLDSHTAPGPSELSVLDELATLTGQPGPPLAGLRSAYRRPEFAVPDTVTTYSPARTDVPAVIDVSAVARAAS